MVYKPHPALCTLRRQADRVFQAGASVAESAPLEADSLNHTVFEIFAKNNLL
jgi:hypothetical protein